jgi:hypothetical protein
VAAYKSPIILSRVPAAGKYAKKEGCCQCMTPGMIRFWKSFAMSSISSPSAGGAAKTHEGTALYESRRGNPTRQSLPQVAWFRAWLDRFFLHGTIVVTDAVYSLVTGFAKPKPMDSLSTIETKVRQVVFTVQYPWHACGGWGGGSC